MSKKLLMNKFNNVDGLSPVQDGLVCWLDAFDLYTYEISTVWLDRTNNGNNGTVGMTPVVTSVGNGVLEAKSFVNIPNPTKGLSDYTVEIGYQDNTKGYWLGLWGNTSTSDSSFPYGISFYQGDNMIRTYPLNINSPEYTGLHGGKNYITFTFNSTGFSIYINGEIYESITFNTNRQVYQSNADYFCFMARKPNSVSTDTNTGADFISAKWYYLRIYNRELTEEEIVNNYNYELSLSRG